MAYIHKHKDGWRAQVAKQGVRKSAVWTTKREATEWAAKVEAEIAAGLVKQKTNTYTLGDAITRYIKEVTSQKRGVRFEEMRLNAALLHFGDVPLSEIDTPDLAKWRDKRLETVTGSTVVREANILRNLWNIARKEWKWVTHYPFDGLRLPKENQPRQAIWKWQQIKRVLRAPRTGKTREMQLAFHIALRSGMRLSEVLQSPQSLSNGVVTLRSKTEDVARIPVGRIAQRLIKQASFTVDANEGSVLFSKLCRELLISGLTFHDARGSALTYLSRKVDVLTLARISRHKDLKILLNTYYRATPEEIASRI